MLFVCVSIVGIASAVIVLVWLRVKEKRKKAVRKNLDNLNV